MQKCPYCKDGEYSVKERKARATQELTLVCPGCWLYRLESEFPTMLGQEYAASQRRVLEAKIADKNKRTSTTKLAQAVLSRGSVGR